MSFLILSLLCLLIMYVLHPGSKRIGEFLSGKRGDFSAPKGVKTVADTYGRVREPFLDDLVTKIDKPGPLYTGQKTAPMSAQETASLDKVNEYSNQGRNSTFDAGKAQIEKTLNGSYDPSTSPYYQAVKAQSAQNLADTNRTIASNAAGGGRFFSGSRMKQQARATNDSGMNLDTIMGTLAQQERQNQIAVLPQAMAYGQAEQNLPLQQASALQSLGALPRTLQQNTDNIDLENFYKSQYEYPLSIMQLIAGVQAPPTLQANGASGLQGATGAATQLGSAALMAAIMGA